jgi:hypothetical protein
MLKSQQSTAGELRGAIEDALAAGVITRDEILQMLSTASPTAATNGHALAEPTIGADDLPIYTELPEGMIDLPKAARDYGCNIDTLRSWVRRGHLVSEGRLRGSSPGGGFIVVSVAELEKHIASPRKKGRKPRKICTV